MKKIYRITGTLLILVSILLACDDPFSYSPFEVDVDEAYKNLTEKNLAKLRVLDTAVNQPFKVALISDTHYHFDALAEAVTDINKRSDIAFIVVTGDITENGLLKEFEIFQQIMQQARVPYLTAIGNHDHLSNGAKVYGQMFGPLSYAFSFHGVKFIIWDNTAWESEKPADFSWVQQAFDAEVEAESFSGQYHHVIPIAHIPPFDGQFEQYRNAYHDLLLRHGVKLSVHGHKHEYSIEELYGGDIQYMTVGSPQKRNYAELTITAYTITVRKIDY